MVVRDHPEVIGGDVFIPPAACVEQLKPIQVVILESLISQQRVVNSHIQYMAII